MSNYRDFYIKQIEAKTLEQSNRPMDALKLYLEIIDKYSPSEDTSYKEAIKILKMQDNIAKAIEICELAINQIDMEKLESDRIFYEKQLNILKNIKSKMKEEAKETTKSIILPKHWLKILSFIALLFVSFVLSWDSTSKQLLISKFAFIIATISMLTFIAEFIKNIIYKIFNLFPIGMFFLSLFVSMVSAYFIPPPEWAVFFDVNKFLPRSQLSVQNTKDKVKIITNTNPTENMNEEEKEQFHTEKNNQINDENTDFQLDKKSLSEISQNIKETNSIDHIGIISSSQNSIYIHITIEKNLDMDEIKKKAQQCVDDFIASKSDLGNIIQKYHIYVNVNNSRDEIILYGGIKKGSTKTTINW